MADYRLPPPLSPHHVEYTVSGGKPSLEFFRWISDYFRWSQGLTSGLTTDVTAVEGDVSTLQSDMGSVQGDISTLQTDVLALTPTAPSTQTTAYSQQASDYSIIFNGGASITLTLLAPASYPGKVLYVKTVAAFTVVSASSNVVPLAGGAAGTAILSAAAGKWAILQSDGSNWIIMAAG